MCSCTKSIAVVAILALAHCIAGAETTKGGVSQTSASSVFADSFGLSLVERNVVTKRVPTSSPAQPWEPVADSFGLNNVLVSAMADCLTAKTAKPAARSPRCIEM